jgi:hypothetical protein
MDKKTRTPFSQLMLTSPCSEHLVVEILDGCIVLTGLCSEHLVVEILDGCIVLTAPCSEHLDGCRDT